MKLLVAIVIVAMGMSCTSLVAGSCDFPPRLWCSSEEIALQCHVLDQCRGKMSKVQTAPPVNVTLYYESLCPDCKRFFQTQLYKTWQTLGQDVMNLTLVPYGNAHETQQGDKWIFECQHGEQECIGNLIETCAINILKDINVYFPFINCMERSNERPASAAQKCAEAQKIDLSQIVTCSNGQQGNQLEHEMALATDALKPTHRYVPWVTINGVHTEKMEQEAEENLLQLICDTYKGPKPDACDTYLRFERRASYNN